MRLRILDGQQTLLVGFPRRAPLLLLLGLLFLPVIGSATDATRESRPKTVGSMNAAAFFEQNVGQSKSQVKFFLRGGNYFVGITSDNMQVTLPARRRNVKACGKIGSPCAAANEHGPVLEFEMVGRRKTTELSGRTPIQTHINYYVGKNPRNWLINVPVFRDVVQHEVYSGIDVVYHGNGNQLEYEFLVSPGANAADIRVRVAGVQRLRLNRAGDLILDLGDKRRSITLQTPSAFTSGLPCRRPVAARYRLLGRSEFAFALAKYDKTQTLTIDPTLQYSTYLTYGGAQFNTVNAVAIGSDGSMYGTGEVAGLYIPQGAMVFKLSPKGAYMYIAEEEDISRSLVSEIIPNAIAVDSQGNAYITGETYYDDLPNLSPGALQSSFPGNVPTAFVMSINPQGAPSSTYLGGLGQFKTIGTGIAFDGGFLYISGNTTDPDFPTVGGSNGQGLSSPPGGFVVKMNSNLSGPLIYSAFFSGNPTVNAIALDSSDAAYVAGSIGNGAYAAKLSPSGSQAVYEVTQLHGTGKDAANGISVDGGGNAYIVGTTNSADFPYTTNGFQPKYGGTAGTWGSVGDAFVAKLGPSGNPISATYLGGGDDDLGLGIAVNSGGNVFVVGETASPDFPTGSPLPGFGSGCRDSLFVTQLSPSLSQMIYSTCLGNGIISQGTAAGIALEDGSTAVVGAATLAQNFPTTADAEQEIYNPGPYSSVESGFLSEIGACTYQVQWWSQGGSEPWAQETYDGYPNPTPPPGQTNPNGIHTWGCQMTTLAMSLAWAGVNQVPVPGSPGVLTPLNPGTLNTYMQNNNNPIGYEGLGLVDAQHTVQHLAQDLYGGQQPLAFVPVVGDTNGRNPLPLSQVLQIIKDAVCNHGPLIVGVKSHVPPFKYPGHFVLVTGVNWDGSSPLTPDDFVINDPGNKTQPAQPETLANYDPQFSIRGYVQSAPGGASQLHISSSDMGFVLTDPTGAQTGYSAASDSEFQDITNGGYFVDQLEADDDSEQVSPYVNHYVDVFQPVSGAYQISVSAQQAQAFTLNVDAFMQNSTEASPTTVTGIAGPGSPTTVQLQLNTAPGGSVSATRVVTFASTIQDVNNSQQLGLIPSAQLAECLDALITNASKAFDAADYTDARSDLLAFSNSVAQASSSAIQGPAGQILSQDANYLFTILPNLSIYPIVNCIINNGNGTYTASLGYQNNNSVAVNIPAGADNFLAGSTQGPPTSFSPGENGISIYQFAGKFTVTFSGNYLFWTLQGPDGVPRTASASASSLACVSPGS